MSFFSTGVVIFIAVSPVSGAAYITVPDVVSTAKTSVPVTIFLNISSPPI